MGGAVSNTRFNGAGTHRNGHRMKTSFTGKRDKRGDWKPDGPIELAPLLAWPARPMAILKWLFGYPGYFLPWGVIYMAFPILTWEYLTPALVQMKSFEAWWIGYILARNYALISTVICAWYLRLYVQKAQGTDYKYSNKWLARDNPIFLFRNQFLDNVLAGPASITSPASHSNREGGAEGFDSFVRIARGKCLQAHRTPVAHVLQGPGDACIVYLSRARLLAARHISDLDFADPRLTGTAQFDQIPLADLRMVEIEVELQARPVDR